MDKMYNTRELGKSFAFIYNSAMNLSVQIWQWSKKYLPIITRLMTEHCRLMRRSGCHGGEIVDSAAWKMYQQRIFYVSAPRF